MSSTFYCTAHDPSLEVSRFYSYSTSTWTEIEKVNTNSFTDVHFYESNKAYATDTDGRIFRNTDVSGTETHWKHRSSNLNDSIKKIRFFNEQQGAAIAIVNGNKRLLFTKDAAKTWEALSDSSYFDIAISDNNSVIAAASKNGRVSLIFPYVSGTHQIAKVETPLLYGELTSIWVEESTSGSIHIMLTDERYLRYTENGLVVNPNWEISNYNSTTGSFIKELIATTNSSGNLYGLAITNSGQAWKLKKEIAPFVEIAGQVAGSNYKKAVLGDAYFYTLSSTDLIDRLDIDPGTGKVFVGNSLSIAHHLSYHSDKLLVANNDGDISRIILMNGGTSIDSNTDQSLTIYPDRINVLKKDKVQDRLYAYGDDGLIYLLNGLGDTFEPIKNNINKNIYNAVSSDFNMCFVGEKGLAKVGSTNGNVLNHFDLKLSFSQTVSSTFGNTDFHGVELASNNRLYIVGEYGAFLYNPNFGDFTGNDFVTIVNQENINLWDVSELSGTGNVFISGNNGLIQKQYGSTGIVNQQLFIPSIKDIHFKDGASATIVADNFVVRTTSNGGGSWKIALPQGSIAPTATYDKVWTLDNGKSLLLGNGNTLVHDRNSGITGTAFNSTHVRAVGKGTNDDNIFIVDDLSIKRINISTLATTPISTLGAGEYANAIQVFTNGDHIVVGNNGLYKHFNTGGGNISSSTGISSTVNFNDIAFKDHINGIIVGDDGIYYRTKDQTISPTGYMSNTNWELKDLNGIDPLVVNNANIYSLAIASSVDILIGGENPSANSGAQYPYVRKIYDAGGRYSNRFYYDKLGRLVVSQNARQEASTSSALNGKYSYTLYDELGRVIEVGEKTENTGSGELQFKTVFGANVGGVFNPSTIDDMRLKLWVDGSGARSEVTKSYYDKPIINGLPSAIVADVHTQRQRIVHVTYEEIFDGDDQTFDHATHYSYDIHGNVETLLQDNKKMEDNFPSLASQRFKRMDYYYDLLSGNVHRMSVQNGESDQWHHAYVYDADNRIEKVYTNTRSPLTEMNRLTQNKEIELSHNADWQNDAHYYYYDHGPLARVEIGQNNLQGVDYYYNLQGWLKGVNSSVLSGENDPGSDSHPDSLNGFFGKDVFGFGLHYYNGDYKAIGGAYSSSATSPIASVNNTSHADGNSYDLYNGNIRYMQTAITNPLTREEMPMLNAYKYDQLNRLKESRSYENGLSTNTWNPSSYGSEYYNAFTYDAMGNILTQERHNRAGQIFDDLKYNYQMDGNGNLLRNRLYSIKDDTTLANVMEDDIEDMDPFISAINQINTHNNYSYDAEGRLVKDKQEEIDTIIWTVSGKVKEIRRSLASEKKNVIFDYDAMGNRIAKHIYNNQTAMLERSTYYILDAQGNQLSMYDHKVTDKAVVYYLADRNIYGSSRLGSLRDTVNMFIPTNLPSYGVVGNRNYELSNHLGNVLAVVNDIVYPISDDSTTILSYEVGLTMVSDYSPFGVQLDGRTIQNEMYSPVSSDTSSQTTPIIAEIYKNEFDSPPATTSPYTGATTTLDGNLSNPVWTSSTGDFTNYNSTGAGSGKSIAIQNASPDTSYVTLSLDVDSGYLFDITSYSFAHRSSSTGYDSYKLVVNGIEIGTGSIYVASSGSTLQSTGVVNVSNVVSGVTGTVNVVLKLYGGLHGSTGTFRMDDFILNGYTQEENAGNGSGNGYVVMGGYRYGFNNKEIDNEWQGQGNSYDYGFRIYNPRIGKFLSMDPLFRSYPFYSPYQFAGNMPIAAVDLDGLEIYFAANGNYIGKWGTSTEVKVIDNNNVEGFQADLKSAHSNPNDWVKQNIMDMYWRGSAGSRSPSTADKNNISRGHVIPESTNQPYVYDCNAAATSTLDKNGYEAGTFWGEDAQHQFQMFKAGKTPNVNIKTTRLAGFEKINTELEAGKPVLIGVDYQVGAPEGNKNTDNTTDHFLLITGRDFDDDGKLYYTGFENVSGGSTSKELNRFYPQSDGTLQGGTSYRGGMTVTQVRPVKEKE